MGAAQREYQRMGRRRTRSAGEALWGAPDAVELSEVVAPGAHATLAVTLEATEPVDGSSRSATNRARGSLRRHLLG